MVRNQRLNSLSGSHELRMCDSRSISAKHSLFGFFRLRGGRGRDFHFQGCAQDIFVVKNVKLAGGGSGRRSAPAWRQEQNRDK